MGHEGPQVVPPAPSAGGRKELQFHEERYPGEDAEAPPQLDPTVYTTPDPLGNEDEAVVVAALSQHKDGVLRAVALAGVALPLAHLVGASRVDAARALPDPLPPRARHL